MLSSYYLQNNFLLALAIWEVMYINGRRTNIFGLTGAIMKNQQTCGGHNIKVVDLGLGRRLYM